MESGSSFDYSISKTPSIWVVSMSGRITQATLEQFQNFQEKLLEGLTAKFVLLDMSHLEGITLDGIPGLVNFQRSLRSKGVEIKLCGMSEALKDKLNKLGVIRSAEISNSLKLAVQALTQPSLASGKAASQSSMEVVSVESDVTLEKKAS